MKKTILMGFAALMICGTVNATSWRVCSKPEAGANFLSVAAAVASNTVFAGDTLYIEPGHAEMNSVTISKRLHLFGPGYFFTENNINAMNPDEAWFIRDISFQQEGSSFYGCCVGGTSTFANSMTIAHNKFNGTTYLKTDDVFSGNIVINTNISTDYCNSVYGATIENNIISGNVTNWSANWFECTVRNNTVISSSNNEIVYNFVNSNIYNNIIINTSDEYITTVNSDQTVDTSWYKDRVLRAAESDGNNVYNNVLSCKPNPEFLNCVFYATLEGVLIWHNANSFEEKFKHIANGPAVSAGVNGTTCGAYGQVNGGRAYQPAGIPQYRPYIYDANIDDTPTNNTINASFKIKVQQ